MPETKELIRLKTLSLNHESEAAADVIEAIKNTVLGNPDGIRYQLLDSLRKLKEIKPLQFFTLRKNSELLYVMALVERITSLKSRFYYTYNVRYVTFSQYYAAQTLTAGNNAGGIQKLGNSFIKEGMRKHAESYNFTLKDESADNDKKLYYAFVEESNLRSMNFTGFFFEPVRTFSVITYSNIFPKVSDRVAKIGSGEVPHIRSLLDNFYKNHSFYFLDENDFRNNYYVVKVGNAILAGVKAGRANWKFLQLPGKAGKFLIKVLPWLPVFSRIIKPGRFSFLTFDTLYCPPGNEKYLLELFESVCAINKVYAAMVYLDKHDELYDRVMGLKNMGLLHRLFKNAFGKVLVRFVNFTDEEKMEFFINPAYLSGYDMT